MTGYTCRWAEHGLALHNSGMALLCCHSRTPLRDNQGQQIFWHTHSLQDALNSPTRQDIQTALSLGQQHPNCDACFSVENAGGESRRQAHNALDELHSRAEIRMLDLKLGNICNLSCRSCNPWVSSKWYSDWWAVIDSHKQEHASYRDYLNEKHLTSKLSYAEDNEQFWQQLADVMPGVDYIDIYGAEPMMIDRLWAVLDSTHTPQRQHQTVHFNTNTTIWDQSRIDVLDQFGRVFLDLSIDGLAQKFEYLRNGADWHAVLDNVNHYRDWIQQRQDQQRPGHLNICITISLFNILDLPEITEFLERLGLSWHVNHAHMPHWINFKILPDSVKTSIAQRLRASTQDRSEYYRNMIENSVISYMQQPLEIADRPWPEYHEAMFQEWIRVTRALDQRRDQDFAATFPELWELVKPWWR